MIVYVTRWALTSGIVEVDGQWHAEDSASPYFTGTFRREYMHGRESYVHTGTFYRREVSDTLALAQEAARMLADRKVAALKRQAAKLSDTNWKAPVVRIGTP